MTPHRKATALVLLGWALLYSRHGNDWRVVGDFPFHPQCQRALNVQVDLETQAEIGGALAGQMPDNPMRKAAYGRAERHVRDRYRCENDA